MVELALDVPATYRIRVKGYLDDRWSDRLGGMAIRAVGQDEAIFPSTSHMGAVTITTFLLQP